MTIDFGAFSLDTDSRRLTRSGVRIHLTPKAYDLLLALVRERPRALPKAELHRRVWPDTHVSDATLTSLVGELREALGETGRKDGFVRTVQRFGFRFEDAGGTDDPLGSTSPPPRERSVWSAGVLYAALAVAIVATTSLSVGKSRERSITADAPCVVVLAEFTNVTGEPVWDHRLSSGASRARPCAPTRRQHRRQPCRLRPVL